MQLVPILGPVTLVELLWGYVDSRSKGTAFLHLPRKLKQKGLPDSVEGRREAVSSFLAECSAKEGFKSVIIGGFPQDAEEARWLVTLPHDIVSFELKVDLDSIGRHIRMTPDERMKVRSELAAIEGQLPIIRQAFEQAPHFLIHGIRTMTEQSLFVSNRMKRPTSYGLSTHAHLPAES